MKSALWLLIGLPFAAHADEAPIVVTGRALSAPRGDAVYDSVVISRDRLSLNASGRLEDVLADVAGFAEFRRSDSRSTNPSAQVATLRGLGGNAASRALVLLDGVPQADPFFGAVPFSALVPDRLGAVRVTRGGGVGAFGAGAVAGTIELSSAARDETPTLAARADFGSLNAIDTAATLAPNLGAGFAAVSGHFERSDGFYTTPPDQRVPVTARARYRDGSGSLRAVVPVDANTELQARALIFRDARTLRFVGADNSASGEDASIRLIRRGRWQVDALAYVQVRDFSTIVVSSTSFRKTLNQRATPSTGVGGKIEVRPPVGGGHVVRIGSDVRVSEGTEFEDAFGTTGLITARRSAGGRASVAGLFVEDSWTVGTAILTGGARIDRWTLTGGNFREIAASGVATSDQRFPARNGVEPSGRLGAQIAVVPSLELRAAAYSGFRNPTLNELYRPFTVFPVTTRANAALTPEHLLGGEVGADTTLGATLHLGVTAFYNRLNGAIANVTTGTNLRQRENVDAIVAKGIEISATGRVGRINASVSYALTDSRVRASTIAMALDGLRPAQTPRHAASATLAWQPRHGPTASLTARYIGAQFEDDLQTAVLPAVSTIDAVARVPLGRHLAIVARGENLFDATVVTRNSGGSIDTGTPRTLWIGLRYE